jgi:integrase
MRCKLTKAKVADAQPAESPYQLHDTEVPGFLLRIEPTGRRSYFLEYRNALGRRLRFRIGAYPAIDPDEARRIARVAAGKVAAGVDPQEQRKVDRAKTADERKRTLGVFVDEQYEPWAKTHLKSHAENLARIRVDFADYMTKPMTALNRWLIEGWRRKELQRGVSPVTVNRTVQRLQGVLSKAVQWGVLSAHPFAGLKPLKTDRRGRVRYLSAEEEQALRKALDERDQELREQRERFNRWRVIRHLKPLPLRDGDFVDYVRPVVLLALNTGLRRGELLALRWRDVDLGLRMLTVVAASAKNGQTRRVPLNREATDLLNRWHAQQGGKPEAHVFAGQGGVRMARIDSAWRSLRKRASLGDCRLHDLRHHFASRLVQQGTDLNVVRELLGHSDITMVLRYAHLDPKNLAAAVERVAREPVAGVGEGSVAA